MRAVVCQNEHLQVREIADPVPQKGQVLLKVLRCGICGSDLHLRHHCDHMSALSLRVGLPGFPTSKDAIVFGHEFCGEILEHGKGSRRKLPVGTRVCAVPMLRRGQAIDLIGLSATSHGAYAERVVVQEPLMEAIPNGLSDDMAALTEPMAVALHAVRRSEVRKSDVAVVIGCGPVGLGVIAMLKARGVRTIIASDFSPGRRALAQQCGATVVINPAESSPFTSWAEFGHIGTMAGLLELGVSTREKLGMLPVPWWHTWRVAEKAGLAPKRPVIFECVGVPGVLRQLMDGAPLMSRIVVVGVCMQADTIEPAIGINKEIELRFVLGYSPLEYRDALHLLAEGKVNAGCLITGTVGLDGVEQAFAALGNPERHAKILIDPSRSGLAVL
ncbi:zinc-binding dehydrogenase [Perlucidibaca piscinae]|uniref:zinc-binding dehydrogenase n=1 Tax=Perlucidibaca piscinae TaxID=392589 RepID=UPI0003B6A70C|nr:zinc-binding dehydrogenase [Perlucidibaca piscinae]